MPRAFRWAIAVLGLVLLLAAGNTAVHHAGLLPKEAPEARAERLAAHWRVVLPPGDGPYPAVLMLGGCDGPMDNLDLWAERLAEAGWASVILDSHSPRGLRGAPLWRLVCAGQALQGPERAGDAAAALAAVRALPWADGRVAVLGSSHGGWAVMELLRLGAEDEVPPGLERWPAGRLGGLVGAVVLYPYCGRLNRARGGWETRVPVLLIQGAADGISPAEECMEAAEAAAVRGARVEAVLLEGVGHGFDQRLRSPISPLVFDPAATARAVALGTAFLDHAAGGGE